MAHYQVEDDPLSYFLRFCYQNMKKAEEQEGERQDTLYDAVRLPQHTVIFEHHFPKHWFYYQGRKLFRKTGKDVADTTEIYNAMVADLWCEGTPGPEEGGGKEKVGEAPQPVVATFVTYTKDLPPVVRTRHGEPGHPLPLPSEGRRSPRRLGDPARAHGPCSAASPAFTPVSMPCTSPGHELLSGSSSPSPRRFRPGKLSIAAAAAGSEKIARAVRILQAATAERASADAMEWIELLRYLHYSEGRNVPQCADAFGLGADPTMLALTEDALARDGDREFLVCDTLQATEWWRSRECFWDWRIHREPFGAAAGAEGVVCAYAQDMGAHHGERSPQSPPSERRDGQTPAGAASSPKAAPPPRAFLWAKESEGSEGIAEEAERNRRTLAFDRVLRLDNWAATAERRLAQAAAERRRLAARQADEALLLQAHTAAALSGLSDKAPLEMPSWASEATSGPLHARSLPAQVAASDYGDDAFHVAYLTPAALLQFLQERAHRGERGVLQKFVRPVRGGPSMLGRHTEGIKVHWTPHVTTVEKRRNVHTLEGKGPHRSVAFPAGAPSTASRHMSLKMAPPHVRPAAVAPATTEILHAFANGMVRDLERDHAMRVSHLMLFFQVAANGRPVFLFSPYCEFTRPSTKNVTQQQTPTSGKARRPLPAEVSSEELAMRLEEAAARVPDSPPAGRFQGQAPHPDSASLRYADVSTQFDFFRQHLLPAVRPSDCGTEEHHSLRLFQLLVREVERREERAGARRRQLEDVWNWKRNKQPTSLGQLARNMLRRQDLDSPHATGCVNELLAQVLLGPQKAATAGALSIVATISCSDALDFWADSAEDPEGRLFGSVTHRARRLRWEAQQRRAARASGYPEPRVRLTFSCAPDNSPAPAERFRGVASPRDRCGVPSLFRTAPPGFATVPDYGEPPRSQKQFCGRGASRGVFSWARRNPPSDTHGAPEGRLGRAMRRASALSACSPGPSQRHAALVKHATARWKIPARQKPPPSAQEAGGP